MAWQLLLGPILGTFGGLAQGWLELKKERARADERALDRAHDLAVMDKEADLATRRLTIEQDMRNAEAANNALLKSYDVAAKPMLPGGTKLSGWHKSLAVLCDAWSSVIRPASTTFYQVANVGVFAWSAYLLAMAGGEVVDQAFAQELVRECVLSIIGMAEMTLCWWYGARGLAKRKLQSA